MIAVMGSGLTRMGPGITRCAGFSGEVTGPFGETDSQHVPHGVKELFGVQRLVEDAADLLEQQGLHD